MWVTVMDKLYALLGMLGNASKDLVFKIAAQEDEGGNIVLFYTLKSTFLFLISGILLEVLRRESFLHAPNLAFGIPIGALAYVSYTLMLKSLVGSDASYNVTVVRLNFAVSSLLAVILFREALTPGKGAGRVSGLRYSIPACLSMAALSLLNKAALIHGAETLALIFYRYTAVTLIGLIVLKKARGKPRRPSKKLTSASLLAAGLMLLALSSIYTGLSIGEVSIVIPITQLSFVFTSALSFLLLKEKPNIIKILGIFLAVLSIIVI